MQPDPELPETDNTNAEAIATALQSVIAQKDEEIATLKDQALRALAEVENMRRRNERELADMSKYAVTGFARDLVNVLENLQRALDSTSAEQRSQHPALDALCVGVDLTLKELLGTFGKHHITRINPTGQKFDHQLHQAVSQVAQADAEPGTVLHVLQAGYQIHDRLLRPAMVVVAAADPQEASTVDTHA